MKLKLLIVIGMAAVTVGHPVSRCARHDRLRRTGVEFCARPAGYGERDDNSDLGRCSRSKTAGYNENPSANEKSLMLIMSYQTLVQHEAESLKILVLC